MTNRKITFYSLLLITYMVLVILIAWFGIMFMGVADYALVITFGTINMCIAHFYFKIESLKSVLIGFLISSLGLVASYLLWMPISNFSFANDIIVLGFTSNAIFQTLSWLLVEKYMVKQNLIKTIGLFLSMTFLMVMSFNLHDFWKFENYYNWNEKKEIIIRVTDSITGMPFAGDSIELSIERQPLYGIMASSTIKKTITDKNGNSKFEVYIGHRHLGDIWRNKKYSDFFDYFEIAPEQIVKNDTIEIKTTATNSYE